MDYTKFKVLYYTWDEIVNNRAIASFKRMGVVLDIFKEKRRDYDHDEIFERALISKINKESYSFVFTFNYFPIVSKCCQKVGVKYVSWIYDSPHSTLESKTLSNGCNRVFIFDGRLYKRYFDKGFAHIYHLPLASDVTGIMEDLAKVGLSNEASKEKYKYNISFVGNINFSKDYLCRAYLSGDLAKGIRGDGFDKGKLDYLLGYLEGYIRSSKQFMGEDMAVYIPDDIIDTFCKVLDMKLGDKYYEDVQFHMRNAIRQKLTINERYTALSMLGKISSVDWFTESKVDIAGVVAHSAVDYNLGMNKVFAGSKININVTLRSILQGVPLRVFDVLAAGGFLLTSYNEEIASCFEIGKELEVFYDFDDMIQKTKFYLENEDIRREIAINGQKRIIRDYSLEIAFGKIIRSLISD